MENPEPTNVFLGRLAVQLLAMSAHAGGIIATSDFHRLLSMAEQTHRLYARHAAAIAKANAYRHSGVNPGDHKVLSEMVGILEGGARQ